MTSKLRETVPAGSWAARAKAGGMQGSFARANSAPASVLASAAKATPAKRIAAKPATPATPFGVVTPDVDANANKGGSWAQRARAAAETEAAAQAKVVEARKIAAYKAAQAKLATKAPVVVNPVVTEAPVDAMDADDEEDWAAEMETEDVAAPTPSNAWAGMASFASMLRA